MNINRYIIGSLITVGIGLSACSDDDAPTEIAGLLTETELSYNASCTIDTLKVSHPAGCKATTDAAWVTISYTPEGYPILYVEQNDEETSRQTTLRLASPEQSQELTLHQDAGEENGSIAIDLPKHFGVGWGYDLKTDYADVAGVRGQVFNAAKLRSDFGANAIRYDNSTVTNMSFIQSISSENLMQEIGGKVTGSVDIKVASAKVSVEYGKQISEQKDRFYVWCRDLRGVRTAYFHNDIDIYDEDVVKWNTTSAFTNSVKKDSPAEIVRKFGTHIVTSALLGGKLDYYFTVSTDVTTTVERVIATVSVKVLFFKRKTYTSVDEKTWTDIKQSFEGNFIVSGGGSVGVTLNNQLKQYAAKCEPLTDETLFDRWYACFESSSTAKDENLVMVDFQVAPIWDIIEAINPTKAAAVKSYVLNTYLK